MIYPIPQLTLNNARFFVEERKQGLDLKKYIHNPVAFAREVLDIELTPDQELILNSLRDFSETNVQSSHGQGKTMVGAVCVLFWVFVINGLAVSTAPTGRQVKELLWGEIRKIHGANKDKLGGVCQILALKLSESARAIGFSSQDSNEHAAQGFHSEFLLIIEDESCGISRAIDEGLSSCLTGENNRILRIGNPVESGTAFEQHCKRKSIKLPAWRHPNISWAYQAGNDGIHRLKPEVQEQICNLDGSLKPQKEWGKWANQKMIPGAVSIRWIETVRSKYEERSSYWISRVEAMFPVDNRDGMIPLSWLLEARNRFDSNPEYWDYQASLYPWRVGIDVADGGGDNHCIAVWKGPVLYSVELITPLNDRQDTLRLAKIASDKFKSLGGDIMAAVDNTGVGAGTLAKLLELGWQAVGCKFGEGADERLEFANRKAELYWQFREKLRLGEYAIAPLSNQDYVFQDLSATRYFIDTKDKIACEPKSKTVGRLKRSPDSEAIIIALENGMGLMVQPTHQTQVVEDDDMAVFRRWERCREPGSIEALKREFTV
jgi:hypothetical protein